MQTQVNKSLRKCLFVLMALIGLSCTTTYSGTEESAISRQDSPTKTTARQKIMLALLLDTSNSMDGLIEQTKSQLWTIVNELAAAKCRDGERPEVNIALFEYGNDGLSSEEGYIRMVSNMTNDLDEISSKLFQLKTNGGDEYCGHVIKKSIEKLNWTKSDADVKMIFIAGNEPFTQGNTHYRTACNLAKDKDIVVNTIFCGGYDEGIRTSWKTGADLTGGSYMSIEQNKKTVYIKTPHDDRIDALNEALNDTYIHYGTTGLKKKEMQKVQDENAATYSRSNKVKRAISKSSHVYKNSSWDLVDASSDDAEFAEKLEEEALPEEMKTMTINERKAYIQEQASKRSTIQKEIQSLAAKRKQYIAENQPKTEDAEMLDEVMIQSIKEFAIKKDLVFE